MPDPVLPWGSLDPEKLPAWHRSHHAVLSAGCDFCDMARMLVVQRDVGADLIRALRAIARRSCTSGARRCSEQTPRSQVWCASCVAAAVLDRSDPDEAACIRAMNERSEDE
jgi:hypothetical protein